MLRGRCEAITKRGGICYNTAWRGRLCSQHHRPISKLIRKANKRANLRLSDSQPSGKGHVANVHSSGGLVIFNVVCNDCKHTSECSVIEQLYIDCSTIVGSCRVCSNEWKVADSFLDYSNAAVLTINNEELMCHVLCQDYSIGMIKATIVSGIIYEFRVPSQPPLPNYLLRVEQDGVNRGYINKHFVTKEDARRYFNTTSYGTKPMNWSYKSGYHLITQLRCVVVPIEESPNTLGEFSIRVVCPQWTQL